MIIFLLQTPTEARSQTLPNQGAVANPAIGEQNKYDERLRAQLWLQYRLNLFRPRHPHICSLQSAYTRAAPKR